MNAFLTLALPMVSLFGLSSCSSSVNSAEKLIEAKGNIKLTSDIDLDWKTIEGGIAATSIDGNGHTIRNAFVVDGSGVSCALFNHATSVKNLVVEDVIVTAKASRYVAIVAANVHDNVCNLENVKAVNCTVSATQAHCVEDTRYGDRSSLYCGGLYGGLNYYYKTSSFTSSVTGTYYTDISSCSLESCLISATGKANDPFYIGGIAAEARKITSSHVKNCRFQIDFDNTAEVHSTHVGGILGSADNDIQEIEISDCYSQNNVFDVSTNHYSGGTFNYYYTTNAFCGGIAGNISFEQNPLLIGSPNAKITHAFSYNNSFLMHAAGSVECGAIAGAFEGDINQSCSANNEIKADDAKEKDNNANGRNRRLAGMIASGESTISSSVSYDNDISDVYPGATAKRSYACGAVCAGEIQLDRVAVKNNQLNATNTDELSTGGKTTATHCYVVNPRYGNKLAASESEDDFFESESELFDKLDLDMSWDVEEGLGPYLSLGVNLSEERSVPEPLESTSK